MMTNPPESENVVIGKIIFITLLISNQLSAHDDKYESLMSPNSSTPSYILQKLCRLAQKWPLLYSSRPIFIFKNSVSQQKSGVPWPKPFLMHLGNWFCPFSSLNCYCDPSVSANIIIFISLLTSYFRDALPYQNKNLAFLMHWDNWMCPFFIIMQTPATGCLALKMIWGHR